MITFAPGPSELYFTVEDHMRKAFREGIPSISHRSKLFESFSKQATEGLKELLGVPSGYHFFFTASATEVWERTIQNLTAEHSFHYVNGAFSKKFHEIAVQLGRMASKNEVPACQGFPEAIATDAELIALVANETSTGVTTSNEIFKQVRAKNPEALLIVDAVSALPYQTIDYNLVDSVYFSVQKGFGLPAGLGVWMVNERCIEKAKSLATKQNIGSYHSIPSLLSFAQKHQTPTTPNVLGIYLLSKIVEDFLRRGITIIRKETEYKSAILYQALEAHPLVKPAVQKPEWRSKTTIVAETGAHTANLTQILENQGLSPGEGYGAGKQNQLRFANFPAHSKETFEKLADALQAFQG
jgi:phosphoserine aminotransferase